MAKTKRKMKMMDKMAGEPSPAAMRGARKAKSAKQMFNGPGRKR